MDYDLNDLAYTILSDISATFTTIITHKAFII
jgi:hypothetical protein